MQRSATAPVLTLGAVIETDHRAGTAAQLGTCATTVRASGRPCSALLVAHKGDHQRLGRFATNDNTTFARRRNLKKLC
jgi:hypothetical protein